MAEEMFLCEEIHECFSQRILSIDHNRRIRVAFQCAAVLDCLHIVLQNSTQYIACDLRLIRLCERV